MLEGYDTLFYFGSAVYVIAQIIICVACIILVSKYKSIGSIMMLGGSILSIFTFIVDKILLFYASSSSLDFSSMILVQGISSIIGNLSYLIFTVGLLVFSYRTHFRKKNQQ